MSIRPNDWHSSAVIVKKPEDGEFKFLVQDSRSLLSQWSSNPPQTKCIGGGAKPQDLDPRMTLAREMWEEIFLYPSLEASIHRLPIEFKRRHQMYFDLVWFHDLKGTIRDRHSMFIDGDSLLYNIR